MTRIVRLARYVLAAAALGGRRAQQAGPIGRERGRAAHALAQRGQPVPELARLADRGSRLRGLALERGETSPDFAEAQASLLDELGLASLEWRAPAADLLAAMKRDKKARGGEVRFVLARDIAQWETKPLPDETILSNLSS